MHRNLKTSIAITVLSLFTVGITSCKTHRDSGLADNAASVETIHIGKSDQLHERIVQEALTWVGTPYQYAGLSKGEGTDCSGMVMKVYEDVAGCKIPRNSAKQAEFCHPISADQVRLGDLIFFATGKDIEKVSHVGIIIDDHRFVHASSSKGVVISEIYTPYYRRTFKMFGRVPKEKDSDGDLARVFNE